MTASTTRSAARPSTSPTTLARDPSPLCRQLLGPLERPLDPGDHVVEALRPVERVGLHQPPVVLAHRVQRRPALAGRRTFVVEDAHGRAVVDDAVEQDRAGIRDDAVAVLEHRCERLQIGVAGLLHVRALEVQGCGEALAPAAVARVRAEEEREARRGAGLAPPVDEALDETLPRTVRSSACSP